MKTPFHCISLINTLFLTFLITGCAHAEMHPKDIFGNPDYRAASWGGYRETTRDIVPTVEELKEDVRIMGAAGIKLIRTYNTQQFPQAARMLEAIHQVKSETPGFEMYVMVGAWIDCEGAWTVSPNHEAGSVENNTAEINKAVELANKYPDIVKSIAVGNEAMVHWAASYFVHPRVILKWVNHLQELKKNGELPETVWITSSDNFASWGGGGVEYHNEDLAALISAVDFISVHTYPFHDTHYNPEFWTVPAEEESLSNEEKIARAMNRAVGYAKSQYRGVYEYMSSLGVSKPIHIGETGWATNASSMYNAKGTRAADELKQKLYHDALREWTDEADISCFFFEFFDEQWKDEGNPMGSENHFGLINLKGQAKYALWDLVDAGAFEGLTRDGYPIAKSYGGDLALLKRGVMPPPSPGDGSRHLITTINTERSAGDAVAESTFIVLHNELIAASNNDATYPTANIKLNVWDGTCAIELTDGNSIGVRTGTGDWWGSGLEVENGESQNLSGFKKGTLHFEIKGSPALALHIGFQTGLYTEGTQINNFVLFAPGTERAISEEWVPYSIPMAELNKGADLEDVTGLLYFQGGKSDVSHEFEVKNIYYTRE